MFRRWDGCSFSNVCNLSEAPSIALACEHISAEKQQVDSFRSAARRVEMVEDWMALITNMNGAVRDLRQAAPEAMKTFGDMARAAHVGTGLDDKTKELMALGIGVAVRCAPCIAYHAQGAVKHGASREEVAETLAMAIYTNRPKH